MSEVSARPLRATRPLRRAAARFSLAILFFIPFLAGLGCEGQTEPVVPEPNRPPDTQLTATPPVQGTTSFLVSFAWEGNDPDGEVAFYEWRMSDNGPDGMVSQADTTGLAWHATTADDSTFTVSADLPGPPLEGARDKSWRTHTFFVRAVDDGGARDPDPAEVSFTSLTLAPGIAIHTPPLRGSPITCISTNEVLSWQWEPYDEDGGLVPALETRYLLLEVEDAPQGPCLTQRDYEMLDYVGDLSPDDPRWSDWRPYDPSDVSSYGVTLGPQEIGASFLFLVQARDIAGAVTPTFRWNRNVRHVRVMGGKNPVLIVDADFLGRERVVGLDHLRPVEVFAGQTIEFAWEASAEEYSGLVDGYRYGWNVVDLSDPDDVGWVVDWGTGEEHERSLPHAPDEGMQTLTVEVRDNSMAASRATFVFMVVPSPERRDQRHLLLIDDWPMGGTAQEAELEAEWDRRWLDVLSLSGVGAVDVIDASEEPGRIGPTELSRYKGVIWFSGPSDDTFFHNRLAPVLGSPVFRSWYWIEQYQAHAGNLLAAGPGALHNSMERNPPGWIYPIILSHPSGGCGISVCPPGRDLKSRWPYTAWCLEAIDYVRPPIRQIFGEVGRLLERSLRCDGLHRALVADEFLAASPGAAGQVRDLEPSQVRFDIESPDPGARSRAAQYRFVFEEFYNVNVTTRNVILTPRDCQVPVWRWRARRDEGLIAGPDSVCHPPGSERSRLEGAPVAIMSTVYSDTKPILGSADFVWGFHPLAFEMDDVADALRWIFTQNWRLDE